MREAGGRAARCRRSPRYRAGVERARAPVSPRDRAVATGQASAKPVPGWARLRGPGGRRDEKPRVVARRLRRPIPVLGDRPVGVLARVAAPGRDRPLAAPGRASGHDVGRAPPTHRATLRPRRPERARRQPTARNAGRLRGLPCETRRPKALRGRSGRLPRPARRHHRDGALATGPDGPLLVRVAAKVQAMLPPTRPGRLGLTDEHPHETSVHTDVADSRPHRLSSDHQAGQPPRPVGRRRGINAQLAGAGAAPALPGAADSFQTAAGGRACHAERYSGGAASSSSRRHAANRARRSSNAWPVMPYWAKSSESSRLACPRASAKMRRSKPWSARSARWRTASRAYRPDWSAASMSTKSRANARP